MRRRHWRPEEESERSKIDESAGRAPQDDVGEEIPQDVVIQAEQQLRESDVAESAFFTTKQACSEGKGACLSGHLPVGEPPTATWLTVAGCFRSDYGANRPSGNPHRVIPSTRQ